jgi:hypothetical protein
MKNLKWWSCALIAVMALAFAPAAIAQEDDGPGRPPDPEKLARRCMKHVEQHADRCVEFQKNRSDKAVKVIARLLEQGKERAAKKVAREAIGSINCASGRCAGHIRKDARRCAAVLVRLGEPELAEKVLDFADHQVERVRRGQKRAIKKILAPFPGPEPTPEPTE